MKKTTICVAVLLVFVVGSFATPDNHDPIPQREFAALLASHLDAESPVGGWTPQDAIPFLSELMLIPIAGEWDAGATLNEGNMAHILRLMGIPIYTNSPDEVVTFARAHAVFYRYDEYIQQWNLRTLTTGGETTTHVDTGLPGSSAAAPAASQSIP